MLVDSNIFALDLKLKKARGYLKVHLWTGHFTSENLIKYFEKIGKQRISRETVYRTIKLLEEVEIIALIQTNSVFRTYEKSTSHHDRMICCICRHLSEFFDSLLKELQQDIYRQHGFEASYHTMNIHGIYKE